MVSHLHTADIAPKSRDVPSMRTAIFWHFALVSALCIMTMGLQTGPAAQSNTDATVFSIATKIEAGTLLKVGIAQDKTLSGLYAVDDEGVLHFQLADDAGRHKRAWKVLVAGMIADEARGAIMTSLRVYFVAPEVQVTVVRVPRLQIEVRGEAKTPGKLLLGLKAHVSDALAQSGYRSGADISRVAILRSHGLSAKSIPMDYGAFLRGAVQDDPLLEDGDMIVLPALPSPHVAAELKLVRIRGEVNLEANFPIEHGMTVRDVFQHAGGLKAGADRDKVRLVRGSDGVLLELDADKIEADDPVYNLTVGAGDLILVQTRDASRRFSVLGEVMTPHTFAIATGEKVTLLRAMERVGGITKDGDHKVLLRKGFLFDPTQSRDLSVDIDKVRAGQLPDWEVEAGDAIVVGSRQPKASIWKQLLPLALRFLPLGF